MESVFLDVFYPSKTIMGIAVFEMPEDHQRDRQKGGGVMPIRYVTHEIEVSLEAYDTQDLIQEILSRQSHLNPWIQETFQEIAEASVARAIQFLIANDATSARIELQWLLERALVPHCYKTPDQLPKKERA